MSIIKENNEREEFDFDTLPPHYQTLRIPFEEFGSLSERRGYMRLYGHESITSWNNQAMVARRLQSHYAEATVEMEFTPRNFQQMAGLSVFYDTYNFFYFYMSSENGTDNYLRIIARDNLRFYNPLNKGIFVGENKRVWLRAKINECALDFYYSLNGEDFVKMCDTLDMSNLSDEAYVDIGFEGHTGTYIAMACQDLSCTDKNKCNYADFKNITYKEL